MQLARVCGSEVWVLRDARGGEIHLLLHRAARRVYFRFVDRVLCATAAATDALRHTVNVNILHRGVEGGGGGLACPRRL